MLGLTAAVATDDWHARYENGRFVNTETDYAPSASNLWDVTKAYFKDARQYATPTHIPVVPLTTQALVDQPGPTLYRLGHSTVLIKLDGQYILTDPVFSERASPFSFAGPKRFHSPPISLAELPAIDTVIISHDHYDHMDKVSLLALEHKVTRFVTPLKVGQRLVKWGIDADKVVELDWWQGIETDSVEVTATPAQHFSGRGVLDSNRTLWASWVIEGDSGNVFFSGDTGYFSGFAEIGRRKGPFDVTLMETGAYNALWKEIHMSPEQSVQAHQDVRGKVMIPIHNGTFDLALHDWNEPLERVEALATETGIQFRVPFFGESVSLKAPGNNQVWWREGRALEPVEVAAE